MLLPPPKKLAKKDLLARIVLDVGIDKSVKRPYASPNMMPPGMSPSWVERAPASRC